MSRHILGHVVRSLRQMAVAGAPLREILEFVRDRSGTHERLPFWYLSAAFLQGNNFFFVIGPGTSEFCRLEESRAGAATEMIYEYRDRWETQRFPELPRIRDYFSFLEFARDERVIVTVCDVPPGADEYRLHGVYDTDSGEPVWSGKRGERLRAAINRRLGGELVRRGPHDDWEHRNDRALAGPLWGPQAPAITFDNRGGIENRLTVRDLARHTARWDQLYPHHPISEEDSDDE
jgi:hypothetical protein